MKKIIEKPGKTKAELLKSLEQLKEKFKYEIEGNNVEITNITDGYKIHAEKRIIVKFHVDAEIVARDGEYEISWDTNAPKSKVEDAMKRIEQTLLSL
jgi:translation elongation factor EF-G